MMTARVVPIALAVASMMWPAASNADGLPVPLDTSSSGVAAPGGGPRFFAVPADRGAVVVRMSADGTAIERRRFLSSRVPGVPPLAVPGVALDGSVSGLSADGQTLVLIEPRQRFPRNTTRLAVLETKRLKVVDRIELEGDFSFDAISPDGSTIYLINYIDRRDPTRYEVRAYDVDRRSLARDPIVESGTAAVVMRGLPTSRVTSPDGSWEYTLYDGNGETPFVHALNVEDGETVCIEVGDYLRQGWAGTLDIDLDGTTVTVSGRSGPVAAIDTGSYEVTDLRDSASSGLAPADEGGGLPGSILVALATSFIALGLGLMIRRRHRHLRLAEAQLRALDFEPESDLSVRSLYASVSVPSYAHGMEPDHGHAIHYSAVERGTPIYASDGEQVGEVVKVLDNYREHILDGIIFLDGGGPKRFVDGPEVQRTFERAVELNIPAAEARELGPPPHHGLATIERGIGRFFRRG